MIPVNLTMRNFMPYRDNVPTLNFSGIHTASIWGGNGNGKSAIIDAITWALWGKTRARSDDDLIHLGQNETEVEFDFDIGQQTYRVIRKHARPKSRRASGQSSLEFQVSTGNSFRPITGNSIRETEQKIKDTLHMDYDTFVNSAFLRQGHADEFTISSPAKRKQVLADILGLSFYDELEGQARGLAKRQEMEKIAAESSIKEISSELTRKPEYEEELEGAQSQLAEVEKALKEGEAGLIKLRQKKESLESAGRRQSEIEERIKKAEADLGRWSELTRQHNQRISEYEQLIARRTAIEDGYARFTEARKLNEDLNQKLRSATALNERKHQLELAIIQASQSLLNEHTLAESKIGELVAVGRKLPDLKEELRQAQSEINRLAGEEKQLADKKQAEQGARTLFHGLESDKARLEQEIIGADEKLDLLSSQTGAVCPLCERELGDDHRRLIENKYREEKRQSAAALKTKQAEMDRRGAELKSVSEEIPRVELGLNQAKTAVLNRVSLVNREIEEIEGSGPQLDEERKRLSGIEERLAVKDYAAGQQAALNQLESELAGLDYDHQQHEQVRVSLTDLEQYQVPRQKLEEADRLIKQEKEAAAGSEKAALELGDSLEADNQKKETLSAELSDLPRITVELDAAENEYRDLSARQKQVLETVGGLKGRLERLREMETRVKEKEKLFGQASKEEIIYKDLTQAFGKKGIQAWLIEMALPEIEIETNRLLGRMTDNRMNIKIETQRETKAGDTVETLDIKIADELGTRNYEMFSGGEAFRINFAIRIALSKLLARRAGAPLPTLIIDEGFGTQDSAGLEKLKEAIISIQDDFKKILVITHIEELRDAFPTRIDVIKTPEGSTIEVN